MTQRNVHIPEVALWRAVITQAITDATEPVRKLKSAAARKAAAALRDQARAWLLGRSKDFREVCFMAQLEPDAVYESAAALSRNGWGQPVQLQRPRQKRHKRWDAGTRGVMQW